MHRRYPITQSSGYRDVYDHHVIDYEKMLTENGLIYLNMQIS